MITRRMVLILHMYFAVLLTARLKMVCICDYSPQRLFLFSVHFYIHQVFWRIVSIILLRILRTSTFTCGMVQKLRIEYSLDTIFQVVWISMLLPDLSVVELVKPVVIYGLQMLSLDLRKVFSRQVMCTSGRPPSIMLLFRQMMAVVSLPTEKIFTLTT